MYVLEVFDANQLHGLSAQKGNLKIVIGRNRQWNVTDSFENMNMSANLKLEFEPYKVRNGHM